MRKVRQGFTLIELLVVVAIIALLISILLPALKSARDQAKKAVCSSNLRSVVQAMINYTVENRDFVPPHQGPEPDYVYIRNSSLIMAPGHEWHLGELLMPMMKMDPPVRGADRKFIEDQLYLSQRDGAVFYCPSTGNAASNAPAMWGNPSYFGSFMDYAQFWGFMGHASIRVGGRLLAVHPEGVFYMLDDEQNVIPADPNDPSNPQLLYELPYNTSRMDHIRVQNSNTEIPVFGDYLTSFNRQAGQIKSDFEDGWLSPEGSNHPWTGHTSGSGLRPTGGNFAYIDGHVEWRSSGEVRPRLLIDRVFSGGSSYPTYWW